MAETPAINLLLLDGTTDGRVKCTINGKTGIIFKIPRKDLAKCKNRNELNNGGVYLLFGERNGRQIISVGRCFGGLFDNFFDKLCEHDSQTDKNFWTEAIVLTTADDSLGTRGIILLEDNLVNEIQKTGRIIEKIEKDEQPDACKARVEFARLALGTIGYKIFEPLKVDESDEEIFYLERYVKRIKRTIHAKMKRTPTGYRVLAGSEICLVNADYLPNSSKARRASAKIDANDKSSGKLLADVELTSPSTAAEFILGNNANGLTEWITKDGVTFGKFFYGR